MSAVAFGKWYKRKWEVGAALQGKYIDKIVFSAFVTPGTVATAFFRYIRIVRSGGDWKKVFFEEGSEPLNVNAYLPGTIVTSCQHQTIVDVDDLSLTRLRSSVPVIDKAVITDEDFVLVPGVTSVLTGQVTFRDLTDSVALNEANTSPTPLCWWLHPLKALRQLRLAQLHSSSGTSVALLKGQLALRHGQHEDLELLSLWRFDGRPHTTPPLPLFIVIPTPPWNSLTRLLNNSLLELVFTYQIGSGANKTAPIVSRVVSKLVRVQSG
jgi:hypothetical protein